MDTDIDHLGQKDRVSVTTCWETISAEEYNLAFERLGGSFAVHPRVVTLVASLAKRSVRYAGLAHGGKLVAAVPLWGEHIVATHAALKFYDERRLLDIGESEVVLPVGEDVRINVPFKATMISSLHENNIINIEREIRFNLTLAKGLVAGDCRLSAKTKKRRRQEISRFQEDGGRFYHIRDMSADQVVAIFTQLYEKRWGFPPPHKRLLPTVFRELYDMLSGDVLFLKERAVAIRILYKHETPRWLFVNDVQGGFDPKFGRYKLGSIMDFNNIRRFEEEAIVANKALRYCFGFNDATYKAVWSFEVAAYRLASIGPHPPEP
jgi:hypothetical protein